MLKWPQQSGPTNHNSHITKYVTCDALAFHELFITKYSTIMSNWDSKDPIELFFEFQNFANCPMLNTHVIDIEELVILRTGEFPTQFESWQETMADERTWEYFIEFWNDVYKPCEKMGRPTSSMDYGGIVQNEHDTDVGTIFNEAIDAVDNFNNTVMAQANFANVANNNIPPPRQVYVQNQQPPQLAPQNYCPPSTLTPHTHQGQGGQGSYGHGSRGGHGSGGNYRTNSG